MIAAPSLWSLALWNVSLEAQAKRCAATAKLDAENRAYAERRAAWARAGRARRRAEKVSP